MSAEDRFCEVPAQTWSRLVFFFVGAINRESDFSDVSCFRREKWAFFVVLLTKCPTHNLFAKKVLM